MIPIGGGGIDDFGARVEIVGIVVFRWGESGAGIDKPGRSLGVARSIDLVAIHGAPASPLHPSRSSERSPYINDPDDPDDAMVRRRPARR